MTAMASWALLITLFVLGYWMVSESFRQRTRRPLTEILKKRSLLGALIGEEELRGLVGLLGALMMVLALITGSTVVGSGGFGGRGGTPTRHHAPVPTGALYLLLGSSLWWALEAVLDRGLVISGLRRLCNGGASARGRRAPRIMLGIAAILQLAIVAYLW